MPCVVAIHGNESVFDQDLPRTLKLLTLTKLCPGIDTQGCVIKAKIVKKWARSKTLLKIQLAEDGCNERLNVFLRGTFAEECDVAKEGDILAMSNVTVESNTRPNDLVAHSCHVIVDTDEAHVWLLKTRKHRLLTDDPLPSTSAITEPLRVVTLNPPGQFSNCVTGGQSPSDTAQVTTSSNNTKKPSAPRSYTYTPLKDVQSGTVVNVFGVVKFFKQPTKSRGSDYCMVLSIVDPSYDSAHIGAKLKCLLFARDTTHLPAVRRVGDIVRMHRLKISTYKDELQGQKRPGFACLVFDGSVGGSLEPITPNTMYTLTESDLDRVKELRNWIDPGDLLLTPTRDSSNTTLSDVSVGQYFDLTCQVVATCVTEPNVGLLLRVWDGTKVNGATYEEDTRDEELTKRLTCDSALTEQANGYIVDVFVFDDHFKKASQIKPSDFVTFYNLHAMCHKKSGETNVAMFDAVPTIEFCLHHGNSYGRGLTVLPPDDPRVSALKTRLDAVVAVASSSDDDDILARVAMGVSGAEELESRSVVCDENRNSCEKRKMRKWNAKTEIGSQTEAVSRHGSRSGEDARCMLRTATVITSHHHVMCTSLSDVARHSAPFKFRVRCHVIAFHPDVSTAKEFLQLFCPTCHFLSAVPQGHIEQRVAAKEMGQAACLTDPVTRGVRGGVEYYTCPHCLQTQEDRGPYTGPQGMSQLEYVYMLKFVMQDETGWLPVCLWREEAVKFFHQVEPRHLLSNPGEFLRFKTHLVNMCREDTYDNRPTMECCIRAFKTSRGTTYEMFDTTSCLDD